MMIDYTMARDFIAGDISEKCFRAYGKQMMAEYLESRPEMSISTTMASDFVSGDITEQFFREYVRQMLAKYREELK